MLINQNKNVGYPESFPTKKKICLGGNGYTALGNLILFAVSCPLPNQFNGNRIKTDINVTRDLKITNHWVYGIDG